MIARSVDTMTDRAEEILELEDIDPLEKLIRMFSVLCFSGEEENDSLIIFVSLKMHCCTRKP